MENLHLSVMPAKAGIHWLQELGDPRLRGDDGKLVLIDTREGGNPSAQCAEGFLLSQERQMV